MNFFYWLFSADGIEYIWVGVGVIFRISLPARGVTTATAEPIEGNFSTFIAIEIVSNDADFATIRFDMNMRKGH